MSNRLYFISEPSLRVDVTPAGEMRWVIDDVLTCVALDYSTAIGQAAFIGRVSVDATGQLIMERLCRSLDTAGVDVYTDVPVQLTVASASGDCRDALYAIQSAEVFNPVWPRFEEGDMVVWGGYFSLNPAVHQRLMELLRYAAARKVKMVYVPYFTELQVPRVTRVMPEIFDNLELAGVVVATTDILRRLFDSPDMKSLYRDHLNFYVPSFYALEKRDGGYMVDFSTQATESREPMSPAALLHTIFVAP